MGSGSSPRSFTANCTAPLHFVQNGTAFLVKPADFQQNREYQNVITASATIHTVPGLDDALGQVNALDAKFPGAKKDVPGHPDEFTLPMVPIGGPPIDIT